MHNLSFCQREQRRQICHFHISRKKFCLIDYTLLPTTPSVIEGDIFDENFHDLFHAFIDKYRKEFFGFFVRDQFDENCFMTCIAICVSLRKKWGVECLNIVSEHARSFQHMMVVKLLNSVALPSAHSSLVGSGFRLFSFFYLLVCFFLFILFFYRCSCPCLLSALTAVDDDGGSGGARMATTLTQKQQRVAVVTQTSNG